VVISGQPVRDAKRSFTLLLMRDALKELLAATGPLIDLAIEEDIGSGDVTSQAILDANTEGIGCIASKSAGVVAGLPIAEAVFHRVDPSARFVRHVDDGQEVVPGEVIAEATGPVRSLLSAERMVLNFLQRLSGIATLTRCFVDAVATTNTRILDTRKTVPGYRILDKYAVRMGGGHNHRMSLSDMILIKDNHIEAAERFTTAVERARKRHPGLPIEVEVRNLIQLEEALRVSPPLTRILLDNMDLETMHKAVLVAGGRVPLEASGNVTLENVAAIAQTGVDFISVGALTHSTPALDLSMTLCRGRSQQRRRDLHARIKEAKKILGKGLVILGHHYQRDEVIAHADFRGDSLELARSACETDAEFIVFCGVRFMAEVAAILAKPGQHVLIPDDAAGCYLADTAHIDTVRAAWDQLTAAFGDAYDEVMPIVYVNSSAALKAFAGKHGGVVCTSGNAEKILRWALTQRPRVFFLPDQHLGRNAAERLGFASREIHLWDLGQPPDPTAITQAKVILWPGACSVHRRFYPEHVQTVRAKRPGIRVLVHPECSAAVVDLADAIGSTSQIIEQVDAAKAGTTWAIGTEFRFVKRLQSKYLEQTILPLADPAPVCRTMSQITLENLASTLELLAQANLRDEITVDAETARWAKVAIEGMLAL